MAYGESVGGDGERGVARSKQGSAGRQVVVEWRNDENWGMGSG